MDERHAIRWAVAAGVSSARDRDGAVILEPRTGTYFTLNAVGDAVWRGVERGASSDEIARAVAESFAAPRERVARDVETLLATLSSRGLVRPAPPGPPAGASEALGPPEASPRTPARETSSRGEPPSESSKESDASRLWAVPAWLGLLAVDGLLASLGFGRVLALITRVPPRRRPDRDLSKAKALSVAVDRAAGLYFKRAWCLQRSIVTAALLRLRGFPATLVIGARRMPFYAHAWVELEGAIVNDGDRVRRDFAVLGRYGEANR